MLLIIKVIVYFNNWIYYIQNINNKLVLILFETLNNNQKQLVDYFILCNEYGNFIEKQTKCIVDK